MDAQPPHTVATCVSLLSRMCGGCVVVLFYRTSNGAYGASVKNSTSVVLTIGFLRSVGIFMLRRYTNVYFEINIRCHLLITM